MSCFPIVNYLIKIHEISIFMVKLIFDGEKSLTDVFLKIKEVALHILFTICVKKILQAILRVDIVQDIEGDSYSFSGPKMNLKSS